MEVFVMVNMGDGDVDILTSQEFQSVVDNARMQLQEDAEADESEADFSNCTDEDIIEMYYGDEVQVFSREFAL